MARTTAAATSSAELVPRLSGQARALLISPQRRDEPALPVSWSSHRHSTVRNRKGYSRSDHAARRFSMSDGL